jgi:heat shock factor-binding protein 1
MASSSSSVPQENKSDDTAKAVQQLLETMQQRFQGLSESIINRIDAMGNRIDDLERSIKKMTDEQNANSSSPPVGAKSDSKQLTSSSSSSSRQ